MSDTPRTDALMYLLAGIELTMPSLVAHARKLERECDELRADAECFRLWIREAESAPCGIAKAIANCVTAEDYRRVLMGMRDGATRVIAKASE